MSVWQCEQSPCVLCKCVCVYKYSVSAYLQVCVLVVGSEAWQGSAWGSVVAEHSSDRPDPGCTGAFRIYMEFLNI